MKLLHQFVVVLSQTKYALDIYLTELALLMKNSHYSFWGQCQILSKWWQTFQWSHSVSRSCWFLVYFTITHPNKQFVVKVVNQFNFAPRPLTGWLFLRFFHTCEVHIIINYYSSHLHPWFSMTFIMQISLGISYIATPLLVVVSI